MSKTRSFQILRISGSKKVVQMSRREVVLYRDAELADLVLINVLVAAAKLDQCHPELLKAANEIKRAAKRLNGQCNRQLATCKPAQYQRLEDGIPVGQAQGVLWLPVVYRAGNKARVRNLIVSFGECPPASVLTR